MGGTDPATGGIEMKEQRIVLAQAVSDFTDQCNHLMENGWLVVPGSFYAMAAQAELPDSVKKLQHKNTKPEWRYFASWSERVIYPLKNESYIS
jgi:hypothetical protein